MSRAFWLVLLTALSLGGVEPVSAQSVAPIELSVNAPHVGMVSKAAFSGDDKYLVTASSTDKSVRVWEMASGRLVRAITGVDSPTALQFSGDPRVFALGANNGDIFFYDIRAKDPVRVLKGHKRYVWTLDFSPDGRTLLSGSYDGSLKIWNVADGQQRASLSDNFNSVDIVRFISNASFVTATRDKKVRLWSLGRTTPLLSFDFETIALTVSPDRNSVVAVNGQGSAAVIDVQRARVVRTIQLDASAFKGIFADLNALQYSSDGKILLSLTEKGVSKYDPNSGVLIATGGGAGQGESSMLPFSKQGGPPFRVLQEGRIVELDDSFRPRRKLFSVLGGYWPGTTEARAVSDPSVMKFIQDSFVSDSVRVDWKSTTARLSEKLGTKVDFVQFSGDGHLVIAKSSTEMTACDVKSDPERLINRQSTFVPDYASFRISQDGEYVANPTPRQWQQLKIWRTSDNSIFEVRLPSSVREYRFTNDNRFLIATTTDNHINVVAIPSGQLATRFPVVGNELGVFGKMGLSADGSALAIGGQVNQVWELRRGVLISTLQSSPWSPLDFSFAKDGRFVLSKEPTTQVWETATGKLLVSSLGLPGNEWITLTPEGFFDASSPKAARNLNVVRGLDISSIDQVYNALYRPDLVREKLAGDPNGKVRAAAAQLDLAKVMASGAAPKVAITSPASGSSSVDEVEVQASVNDQGGGIGKVEWRINGVTLGVETRGLERIESGNAGSGDMQTVKRKLTLERGDNRIEVLAYNAKNLIASEAAEVMVKWDGEKTATPPKLHVLAVGINDYYDSRLRLTYAVPDATALAEGFRKAGAGLYAGVEVMKVLDADVTIANLDRAFNDLGRKVQPRDVFVFFLAGHGKTKNGRYYFLPRDFRYEDESSIEKSGIDQDKFQAWFARIPARKSILLYDTCESGSLTGNTRGSDIEERLGALNRMARATGRTFLTATTDDAPALEGYRGHGVFTYALLDALDHADVNKNGLIEVSELADYIDQKVPDFSFEAFQLRQIPQRSIVGNNFALTNKAEVLSVALVSPKNAAASIPARPTHVVVTPVDVKEGASEAASTVIRLTPGVQVQLMETASGWVLIARDGQKLGYVQGNAIAGLQ